MPRIAISYRRSDSSAISGRIFDRLVAHYGKPSVFMDIDNIPFGTEGVEQAVYQPFAAAPETFLSCSCRRRAGGAVRRSAL